MAEKNNENGQRFDARTALFLAAVCGQSRIQYSNPEGAFLIPAGYRLAGSFKAQSYENKPEYFGFAIESDRAVVLTFRGSYAPTDWVSDFISQQVPFKPVKASCQSHKGFTDIYMTCRHAVRSILKETDPDKPLFVTGHSLGGALGTLAAFDIGANTDREPIVYTYGSPRVGDVKFARTYNRAIKQHWRVQNEYDIVPHLPPLVYRHRTKKIYYYMHVKGEVKRSFRMGSVSNNHLISSYFADLSRDDPAYASMLCEGPPGWCPSPPMMDS
jgi:triacylglycerol lipase